MKTRDRNWSYVVKSQGASRIASKPQRLGRGKEEFIQSLRGSMALLTPSSPPATLDNTEFPAEHGAPSLSGPHLAGPPASDVSPVLIPRKFCSAFKTSSALLCEAFLSLLLPPHPLIDQSDPVLSFLDDQKALPSRLYFVYGKRDPEASYTCLCFSGAICALFVLFG